MGKYPFQSLLAALLLLALAFSIHDHSPAQAQDQTRVSLRIACETNSDQALGQMPVGENASFSCSSRELKK